MRRLTLILVAGLVCASCTKGPRGEHREEVLALQKPPVAAAEAEPAAATDVASAPTPAMAPPPTDGSAAVRIAAGPPMLAYSYSFGLSLPHSHVDELRRRHEAACTAAGYRVCQVVSTSITSGAAGAVQGELVIRAAPAWLKPFRTGLEDQVRSLGGKIDSSDVTSEDLSRQIVDTDAQLRAKLTLRDRLQNLLATRPGRLADLLAVERELARVQGEIDSTQSQLTIMQGRVAMSDVTLNYTSGDVLGASVRSPLRTAFGNFFGDIAGSVAMLVELVAVLLPWALLAGALAWLFRKRLGKLRWPFRRKTPPPPPPPPPPPAA